MFVFIVVFATANSVLNSMMSCNISALKIGYLHFEAFANLYFANLSSLFELKNFHHPFHSRSDTEENMLNFLKKYRWNERDFIFLQ